jgi:hypothetical protein
MQRILKRIQFRETIQHHPKMFAEPTGPFTREALLGMKAEYDERVKQQEIKNQVYRIKNEVISLARQGKTEYILPTRNCDDMRHFTETIAALQEMFPGSKIESTEQELHKIDIVRTGTKITTTQVVRTLKIDWS